MAVNFKKAVFIDKDGTLIHDVPYNVDPRRITLYPDAGNSLQRLKDLGYLLIVVSNQSGVSRGIFPRIALDQVSEKVQDLLSEYLIQIDDFYYCPHDSRDKCECRKPKPGMLLRAARRHRLDLTESWMIGDILNDVEAGNRAGCRTILLENGNETEWSPGLCRTPQFVVKNLTEAADIIEGLTAMERRQYAEQTSHHY